VSFVDAAVFYGLGFFLILTGIMVIVVAIILASKTGAKKGGFVVRV